MKTIGIAVILATLATTSYAGFVNESSENPFAADTQVKIFGSSSGKGFDTIRGMGRDQPLVEAVSQIVPRTYSVKTVGIERWAGTPVSWTGGKDWAEVLRDTLTSTPDVIAEIEMDGKVVVLRTRSDLVIDEKKGAESGTWEARTDDRTVKGMVSRWAKTAGWQVYWESSVDYPILASATVTGKFEEAIEKVIKSMQGAEVPPKAVFYENRVLRITSKGVE